MKKNVYILEGLVLAAALVPMGAQGAGFALVENSASGMGNAFAGGAAIAIDPSTVVSNPAGMSQLDGTQMLVAAHYISPVAKFSNEGSTDGLGNPLSGQNDDGGVDAIVPNLYLVSELGEGWHFGLAMNAPFGLTTEYDDNWVGRYHALDSSMSTVNITPSLAYRAAENLSIGAGLSAQYVHVTLSSAIDTGAICIAQELGSVLPAGTCSSLGLVPQQSDGYAEISGSNWNWGWNVGLLYRLNERTRLGLAYRSAVKQTVSGNADFTLPGEASLLSASGAFTDSDVEAKVTLPASASLSYFQQLSDTVAVMADATWTNWAVFDELRITYDNPAQPDTVTTENWQDSWRYALGINYALSGKTVLRAGMALDQSPVPDAEHRTPRIPDGDRRWLSLGARYRLSDKVTINGAYAHLFIDEQPVNHTLESTVPTHTPTLKGSYESSVDIFSLQMTRHF